MNFIHSGFYRSAWLLPLLLANVSPVAADTPPNIRDCLDRMVSGVFTDSYGRRAHDTSQYPRYSQATALRICSSNLANWQTSADCMDRLSAGIYTDAYGRRPHDSSTHPRYDADTQAVTVCVNAGSNWQASADCLDRMTAGVFSDSYGRRAHDASIYPRYEMEPSVQLCSLSGKSWSAAADCMDQMTAGIYSDAYGRRAHDSSVSPRYSRDVAFASCSAAGNPIASSCISNLVSAGVDASPASIVCNSDSRVQVQQCVLNFKVQAPGLVSDMVAAQICLKNPSTQPSSANAIARCLNPATVGQQNYDGTAVRASAPLIGPAPAPLIPAGGAVSGP